MIKLRSKPIQQASLTHLNSVQQTILSEVSFEDKVRKANSKWDSKTSSVGKDVFRDVKDTLIEMCVGVEQPILNIFILRSCIREKRFYGKTMFSFVVNAIPIINLINLKSLTRQFLLWTLILRLQEGRIANLITKMPYLLINGLKIQWISLSWIWLINNSFLLRSTLKGQGNLKKQSIPRNCLV